MGYVKHNAIVATTWQAEAADALVQLATGIGAEAVRGKERTNGYVTVCITPDGSKEGWQGSDDGDCQRNRIRAWLRGAGEHGFWFEWCEVAFGHDDAAASIVESEWENPRDGR